MCKTFRHYLGRTYKTFFCPQVAEHAPDASSLWAIAMQGTGTETKLVDMIKARQGQVRGESATARLRVLLKWYRRRINSGCSCVGC